MILLKNKDKKANIKIGNNIEIKDGNDFPFDLTLYGKSTQATSTNPVSPSPDFPSPIESVGRKNLFDYTKLNNENTVQWKAYENLGTMFRALPIYVGKNKQVYFSSNVPALTSENAFYAINDINNSSSNVLNINNSRVVSSNNDGYVYLGVVTNRQYYEDVQNNVYWIMISTDNVEYLPYEHTEISATVTGKNLFDKDNVERIYAYIKDNTTWRYYNDSYSIRIPVKPNANYVISADNSNETIFRAGVTDSSDIPVSGTDVALYSTTRYSNTNTPIYITTGANAKYIVIQVAEDSANGTFNTLQLEQSPTATSWEEYKSNSLAINLQGNELCSLPNGTKDEVNITNGEALLIKRVGKIVLDGSENWNYQASYDLTNTKQFSLSKAVNPLSVYNGLSNYFKWTTGWSTLINTDEDMIQIYLDKTLYIRINNTLAPDLATFKTWLSTHNVEVLYELAEPETINLGAVEMPHTYEGVSNITNSADTEMIVKYYKKFEFDKILRSGYNIDEQEYEIAKKQMANGKRKKILSSYVDCIIKIDLGLLDNKTYQEYKEQLEDGEYEYWSYKYNQYKKANFILTKPSITTEYAYDDDIGIDDMEITLEKSSDVS